MKREKTITGRTPAEPEMQWIPAGPPHEWHDRLCELLTRHSRTPLPDCDFSALEIRVLRVTERQP